MKTYTSLMILLTTTLAMITTANGVVLGRDPVAPPDECGDGVPAGECDRKFD
ncbi:hypothetical protein BDN72DRAFT_896739 [Pluteus cervinus]|uniref:Uncharacterized protein n=1 Tax=Pluteus cervinus TaxID=181527 RepID=A0ACD3AYJ5_9AGAR|nr:hypothetical protein BDN72DRAFT_896739 [Pluteus cervinus]